MRINNGVFALTFIGLMLITGYSLYNMNTFMSIEATCHDEFAMIAKCKCAPCTEIFFNLFGEKTMNTYCTQKIYPEQPHNNILNFSTLS